MKSPKVYFLDTGLVCRLLGVRAPSQLATHPVRGALVENLVVAELHKVCVHHGEVPRTTFFRDPTGHEVDVLWRLGSVLVPIEVRAGLTLAPDAVAGLDWYCDRVGIRGGVLVYGGGEAYRRGRHHLRPWSRLS